MVLRGVDYERLRNAATEGLKTSIYEPAAGPQLAETHAHEPVRQRSLHTEVTEHEFVEFFGIVGEWNEDACSYSYTLTRDGLRLLFTLFPLDGGVYTSIYRDGIAEPVVRSRLQGCTNSRFLLHGSQSCLEIGRPEHPTSEISAPLIWGLRLFTEPHFRLEFIHEIG